MKALTRPIVVSGFGSSSEACTPLEPLSLGGAREGRGYDEAWLQGVIDRHPSVLPLEEIEPAFTEVASICRELPLASGYVDNLLVTGEGNIVLVETKLWRNPEARREVVGQILDYAKDLASLDYETLEKFIRQARKEPDFSLFNAVSQTTRLSEASFIDAVTRNLRLGRALLLIVGDGIREGVEQLADFLQRHVGLHFTLGLVELSLWRHPIDGHVMVQPRVLARTVQIERAVIRLEAGAALVPAQIQPTAPSASKSASLTSEAFFESLGQVDASLPSRVREFVRDLEPIGVTVDQRRSLNLKWTHPGGRTFHLGSITSDGQFHTAYTQWNAGEIDRYDLSEAYQAALGALIPGAFVKQTAKRSGWWLSTSDGSNPTIQQILSRKPEVLRSVASYIDALRSAIDGAPGFEGSLAREVA